MLDRGAGGHLELPIRVGSQLLQPEHYCDICKDRWWNIACACGLSVCRECLPMLTCQVTRSCWSNQGR